MQYLEQQLDSILSQTFENFELVISDDSSIDQTWEILEHYASKDSRIKIWRQNKNLGFKKNFEFLLRKSTGHHIALADQDDIWLPNHIELLSKNIGTNLMACGNSELIDSEGRSMSTTMKDLAAIDFIPDDGDRQFHHLMYNNFVQGCTALISRRLIDLALPIPDEVRFHDYWLAAVATISSSVIYVDEVVVKYRQHTNNVIGSGSSRFKNIFKRGKSESQTVCESLLGRFATQMSEQRALQLKEAIRHAESRQALGPGIFCALNTLKRYETIYWSRSVKLKYLRVFKALVGL